MLAMISSFSRTKRAFLEVAIANKSLHAAHVIVWYMLIAVNWMGVCTWSWVRTLKGCKLDGRGQNFSMHYPEIRNHSVHSNKNNNVWCITEARLCFSAYIRSNIIGSN